jgi:hypothetical protein
MKVGDLVRNCHSESGLLGIVLDLKDFDVQYVLCSEKLGLTAPDRCLVAWFDGRVSPIIRGFVEVISES